MNNSTNTEEEKLVQPRRKRECYYGLHDELFWATEIKDHDKVKKLLDQLPHNSTHDSCFRKLHKLAFKDNDFELLQLYEERMDDGDFERSMINSFMNYYDLDYFIFLIRNYDKPYSKIYKSIPDPYYEHRPFSIDADLSPYRCTIRISVCVNRGVPLEFFQFRVHRDVFQGVKGRRRVQLEQVKADLELYVSNRIYYYDRNLNKIILEYVPFYEDYQKRKFWKKFDKY